MQVSGIQAHPERILVRSRDPVPSLAGLLRQQTLQLRRQVPGPGNLLILEFENRTGNAAHRSRQLQAQIQKLKATGRFDWVEPDFRLQAELLPSDSRFVDGTLWGLKNWGQNGGVAGMDAGLETAWDFTTGTSSVVVAVIDTGVRYTHQDLRNQMWINPGEIPGNRVDDDRDGYVDNVHGINAINGSGDPRDDNGHGTHVAGIIGAGAHDGFPHVGVAWNVRIMACKFLAADGGGYVSDAVESINFAVAKGARIINASWGGGGYSASLNNAISYAASQGVLFVAAAGNEGLNNDVYEHYPSNYRIDNVVAVAAHDRFGNLASFSNYGAKRVHLGAPGVAIFSCYSGSDSDYRSLSGTSMAAPFVAGTAALVLSRYPQLTLPQLKARLLETAAATPSLQGKTVTGGRLNASGAVGTYQDGIPDLTFAPASGASVPAGGLVTVEVTVLDGAAEITNASVTALAGSESIAFKNDGVAPDARQGDSVYTGQIPIPSGGTEYAFRVVASLPGGQSATNWVTYRITAVQGNTPPFISALSDREIPEDGELTIPFQIGDGQTRPEDLMLSVQCSNPALFGSSGLQVLGTGKDRQLKLTPARNAYGEAAFKITVSDGALEASREFVVRVLSVNDLPVISPISDQKTFQDFTSNPIVFTASDLETPSDKLVVSLESSNPSLVGSQSYTLARSGNVFTLRIAPAPGRTGTAILVVQVQDESGGKASSSFRLTVQYVAGRRKFEGLVYHPEQLHPDLAGSIRVTTTSRQSFSGDLLLGTNRFRFSGMLNELGKGTTIAQSSGRTLQIELDLGAFPGELQGRVMESNGRTASIVGEELVFGKNHPSPFAGKFVVKVEGDAENPVGYLTVTVDAYGRVRYQGRLADGAAFLGRTSVGDSGKAGLYMMSPKTGSSLIGWIDFLRLEDSPGGQLVWSGASGSTEVFKYAVARLSPSSSTQVRQDLPLQVLLAHPDWSVVRDLFWGSATRLRVSGPNPESISISLSPASGRLRGVFVHPQTAQRVRFEGIWVPERLWGEALWIGIPEGWLEILSPAEEAAD